MDLRLINSVAALAIAASALAPAHAAQGEPPAVSADPVEERATSPETLTLETKESCAPTAADEVVVCGKRGPSYRIDPAILGELRSREKVRDTRPPDYVAVTDQSCVPYGTRGCPGQDVIPVVRMALTAARIAKLALEGEDWREPLRTRPDGYRVYQDEKAKAAKAPPKVSVEFGTGPAVFRPGQ